MSESAFWTVLSAALTPTIAITVAWVAFQQWRTARTRLNLDVFEKRSKVYENAYRSLTLIVRNGSASKEDAFEPMYLAWRDGQFLFGSEVSDHLDNLMKMIAELSVIEAELGTQTEMHSALVDQKWSLIRLLANEHRRLVNWFRPYMLIDERRVRQPSEVFRDLNEKRLSYADEKQLGS